MLIFVSCKKDDPIDNESSFTVNGRIELNSQMTGELTIITSESMATTSNGAFEFETSESDCANIVMVMNSHDDLLMLYRDIAHAADNIVVNAHSTAIALVTLHPALYPVKGEDYATLVYLVENSPSFPKLIHQVEESIAQCRDITDTTNIELLGAMEDVVNEILSPILYDSKTAFDRQSSNCIKMTASGNSVYLQAKTITPTYFGTITYPSGKQTQIVVPTRDDYGIFDLVNNRNIGGEIVKYDIPLEEIGVSNIDLDWTTADGIRDLSLHITKEVLGLLPLDKILQDKITEYCIDIFLDGLQTMWNTYLMSLQPNWEGKPLIDLASFEETFGTTLTELMKWGLERAKKILKEMDLENCIPSLETFTKKILPIYGVVKNGANLAMRVYFAFVSDNPVNFTADLHSDGNISTSEVSISVTSGQHQTAPSGTPLPKPITFEVIKEVNNTSYSVEGLVVKFSLWPENIVVPGELSQTEVTLGPNGKAQVYWTLGQSITPQAEQKIIAYVIDPQTQQIVSNEVWVSAFTTFANYSVNLEDGLVAYYTFDGNAQDYSGNGNNGTLNGATATTDRHGQADHALHFAGVDNPQTVQVPNSSSLQFSDAVSVSMWFNSESKRGMDGWGRIHDNYGNHVLFAKGYATTTETGALNGAIVYRENGSQGLYLDNNSQGINVDYPISTNEWHHVVYIATNSRVKIYVDGLFMGEQNVNTTFTHDNGCDLQFGRLAGSWYPFCGSMDDVRIYNRELNALEIYRLSKM